MKIYVYGNPVLRKRAQSIQTFTPEIKTLCKNMIHAMRNSSPRGVGLAAPQVGIPIRLIVLEIEHGKAMCLANPEIIAKKSGLIDNEGCLSIPGVYANVTRADYILVRGIDPLKKTKIEFEASGFFSRVIQHEIDHLNGILFTDYFDDISSLELRQGTSIPEALIRRFTK